MNLKFNISYNLKFHHLNTTFFYMAPKLTICTDNLFNDKNIEIILDTKTATVHKQYKNIQRGTSLMGFSGIKDELKMQNVKVVKSFYTKNINKIPVDSSLMFFAFATHLNEESIPVQVCVGRSSMNIYQVWSKLNKKKKKRGGKPVKISLELKNVDHIEDTTHFIGLVEVTFYPESIYLPEEMEWSEMKTIPSKEEIFKISERHRKEEEVWLKKFSKVWSGSDKIIDMFGFYMDQLTIPVSFFLQKNRKLREKEFLILFYFALRRYAISKNLDVSDIWENFNKKLPLKEKLIIANSMLTLLSTSHSYGSDHIISKEGSINITETFQDGGKSDTADCEDDGEEIYSIYETFVDYQNIRDPRLKELQILCKMYVPYICLWRTTNSHVLVPPTMINHVIKTNQTIKFKSAIEKRMYECRGNLEEISAHMNLIMIPKCENAKRLKVDDEGEKYGKVIENELKEALMLEKIYKREIDSSFKLSDLPRIVSEGTGEFNPVNQCDPHIVERTQLISEVESLYHTKRQIFHPTGDPYQFYLNNIEFVTPYYMKKYGYHVSNFFPAYCDRVKGGERRTYGITYNDFVSGKSDYKIIGRKEHTQEELDIIYYTCKRRIRPSINKVKKQFISNKLEDIENFTNDIDKVFSMYDFSKVKIIGEPNSDDKNTMLDALKIAEFIKKKVSLKLTKPSLDDEEEEESNIASLMFTCKVNLLFIEEFVTGFTEELSSVRDINIVNFDYFHEVFGENLRNIVFVISVLKK